jgi:hypothetical protein
MKTVEQAARAGAKDGREGLGPLAPKKGAPHSHQQDLHEAYMRAYTDALVMRVGVPERRLIPRKNPRRPARKMQVRRKTTIAPRRWRGRITVTDVHTVRRQNARKKRRCKGGAVRPCGVKRIRRRQANPRLFVLYAHKAGRRTLKYVGHGKFAERGRAMLFRSLAQAQLAAHILKDGWGSALQGYTLRVA